MRSAGRSGHLPSACPRDEAPGWPARQPGPRIWARVVAARARSVITGSPGLIVFGAVCPARGTGAAVIMPAVNVEAMNEIWPRSAVASRPAPSRCWCWTEPAGTARRARGTRQHRAAGSTAVLTGTQPGREYLAIPAQQLSQSPRFDDYQAILKACRNSWNALIAMPQTITSIATRTSAQGKI